MKDNRVKTDAWAKQFLNQPTPWFKNGWKSIELPKYPKNTKDEIEIILDKKKKTKESEKKDILRRDKRKPPFEYEFLDIIGDRTEEAKDFIATLGGQLFTICLYFKNKFNRPRPYVMAKEYKMDFPKISTETGVTPSYPSGHTLNSYFLAHILSKKYPKKKSELFKLAEEISDGRIQMGVHFPSDIDGGKYLAKELVKYYKKTGDTTFKEFFYNFDFTW